MQWVQEVRESIPKAPIVLVGCKSDAPGRCVTFEEGQSMADEIGAYDFLECSARENIGVEEVFQAAAKAAMSFNPKRGGSFFKSITSKLGGGGSAAGDPEKAKLKGEALAAKAKLKEEAEAEKARVKKIHDEEKAEKARIKAEAAAAAQAESVRLKKLAATHKAEKAAWKRRYAAASPEVKLQMKAEVDEKIWMKTATPLEIKIHQKKKAEAEAQRLLLEKADAAAAAAAAAARDAILSGKEPSEYLTLSPDIPAASPSSQQPSPSPVADSAYETLATAMAQKRPCPYTSAKGSCRRMFTAGSHVVFCKIHTCKKPGCNAKKSSAAQFCPTHVGKAPPLPPLPAAFAQPPSEPPAPAPAPTPASPLAQTFDASNPFGPPPPSSEGSIPAEEAVDTAGVAKIGAEIPNPIPGVEETPTLPLAATLAAARVSFPLF